VAIAPFGIDGSHLKGILMSIRKFLAALIAASTLTGATAFAETSSMLGDIQMVLTVADHTNHRPAVLKSGGLTIIDGTITDVTPLKGRDLELFMVIDDAANANDDFSARLQELRHFVTTQPDSVSIGVAYIQNGTLQVVENPTIDHQLAAAALRAPAGTEAANPYSAVSDLIRGWVRKSASREIVLVGMQIDSSAREGGSSVNAETAIQDAERTGVIVYALYKPATNQVSKLDATSVDLGQIAYQTGGEAYLIGHGPAETIEPFLADISEHAANRYLVKFHLTSNAGGGLQTVNVTSGSADQELMAPDEVWVPELLGPSGQ
jgi:hypothetical protein